MHAVILLLFLNAPMPKRSATTVDRVITMRLATRLPGETAPEVETRPPASGPLPSVRVREPARSEAVQSDVQTMVPVADAPVSGAIDDEAEESSVVDAVEFRARILEQVGVLPTAAEADEKKGPPWTTAGEAGRGLPGVRGWLSGHVGPVRPSADTWKAGDGSSRGRYVMADGTVVCTRRRAPTIDESMNPWKSTVITMARKCGRQRPDAPDFTDPRVQPPPRRVVENAPGLDN
jgi:hypothetical protein